MARLNLLITTGFLFFHLYILSGSAKGQVMTNEDSLQNGLTAREASTFISGYGEVKVGYNLRLKTGEANVTRAVLFVGHRFNNKISLFSEMELEDGKIEGGEA